MSRDGHEDRAARGLVEARKPSRARVWLARWTVPLLFLVAALSTGAHTAGHLEEAFAHATGRAWLVAAYGVLRTGVVLAFALFTFGRSTPHRKARGAVAFLACAAAMGAVLAFADPSSSVPAGVVLAGEVIAVAFCAWLLVAVISLGRCFGVLPEARGLVTAGPYRHVRHPVYLGEIGACTGLAIAAASPVNAALLVLLVLAQLVRMGLEEEALRNAFPVRYAEYASRTPRLLPRVRPARRLRASAQAPAALRRPRVETTPGA
jgi:protein-S-isoprenylcysteine O-methyltransferase Ste14